MSQGNGNAGDTSLRMLARLEEISAKLDGLSSIDKRLERVEHRLMHLEEGLKQVRDGVNGVNARIDRAIELAGKGYREH